MADKNPPALPAAQPSASALNIIKRVVADLETIECRVLSANADGSALSHLARRAKYDLAAIAAKPAQLIGTGHAITDNLAHALSSMVNADTGPEFRDARRAALIQLAHYNRTSAMYQWTAEPDAVPVNLTQLPREHAALISAKTAELAKEAYVYISSHICRRVAYSHVNPADLSIKELSGFLANITLDASMTHRLLLAMRVTRTSLNHAQHELSIALKAIDGTTAAIAGAVAAEGGAA